MTPLRDLLFAAFKSLLRGKSFLQGLLSFWINPAVLKAAAAADSVSDCSSVKSRRKPDAFLSEAEELFLEPLQGAALKEFALKLKAEFKEALLRDPACMLPSYNHQLPSCSEHGRYLALDVGGSTLRVALVELRGRETRDTESRIVRLDSFAIGREVKNLEGVAFFDWMADKIVETVSKTLTEGENTAVNPLLMGLAWSFPIEQTSLQGGKLQNMGKGFHGAHGLVGQDIGALIQTACAARSLHVTLAAIVNDSTAALLSQAYLSSSTRFGLILGTGVNIAVHLPVATVGRAKFGQRPQQWFDKASHVIVNTELGMFGKRILPVTRWDAALNAAHMRPDFQPLEYLVSGCYLGEVCRLALLEAIDVAGVLGGVVPPSLLLPYSLDTETISLIEADTSPSLSACSALFTSRHPSPVTPTFADMKFIRTLASYISRRSSVIVAASLFALWQFKNEAEATQPCCPSVRDELDLDSQVVAFNGSVIEHYPGYLENCQEALDALVLSTGGKPGTVSLVGAKESSLLGAAVALACLEEGKAN